jgi:hypothetical protein
VASQRNQPSAPICAAVQQMQPKIEHVRFEQEAFLDFFCVESSISETVASAKLKSTRPHVIGLIQEQKSLRKEISANEGPTNFNMNL